MIARETWIITSIGFADLISTILLIRFGGASEANPVFKQYWDMGLLAFVLMKALSLIGPLIILEWARRRCPSFVRIAMRAGIGLYVSLFALGVMHFNSPNQAGYRAMASTMPISPERLRIIRAACQYDRYDCLKQLPEGSIPYKAWCRMPGHRFYK